MYVFISSRFRNLPTLPKAITIPLSLFSEWKDVPKESIKPIKWSEQESQSIFLFNESNYGGVKCRQSPP